MSEESKLNYLKEVELFSNLQETQLQRIAHLVKIRQLSAREIIQYGSGEFSKIYFIVSGKIKLTEISRNPSFF